MCGGADEWRDQARRLARGESLSDAHPYVRIWLMLRNGKNIFGSQLPFQGGLLDQPFEVITALLDIERAYEEEMEFRRQAQRNIQQLQSFGPGSFEVIDFTAGG